MDQALLVIQEYQGWIYAILILAGLNYLRRSLRARAEYNRAVFGLERDRAASLLSRSLAMLGLVVAVGIATFLAATFLGPSVPAAIQPTPLPTISLLLTMAPAGAATGEGVAPAEELQYQPTVDAAACLNPEATILSPASGAEIQGRVEIVGTANISNFAFYKIEVKANRPEATWQAITAGTVPLVEAPLGIWDTGLTQAGPHLLRLVVTDTAGNAPLPCTFEVTVVPSG